MTEQQRFNPDQVIAEMLRKVADGNEVNGQAYLDMLGDHGSALKERLETLAENESNDTVSELLGELADGRTYQLGEFGDNSESTEADNDASRVRQIADELWPNGGSTPTTGMQPA